MIVGEDCQGTLVFIIPEMFTRPYGQYLVTHTYYGNCSDCDSLMGIHCYSEGLPSEAQVAAYMTLCLDFVQKMKRVGDERTDSLTLVNSCMN